MHVPDGRIRVLKDVPERDGRYVLYWMVAARRTRFHFGLDRALERAEALGVPLVVLEALRCDYPWASDRLHAFVLQGMADNAAAFEKAGIRYWPYVEPHRGAGRGLLAALAADACLLVTDDFPCFFIPKMVEAAARKLDIRFEAVDSNGLYPIHDTTRAFTTAASFRRHLQKKLPGHLSDSPRPNALAGLHGTPVKLSPEIAKKWPSASKAMLGADLKALATLPIDHSVAPSFIRGGEEAARKTLATFMNSKLARYGEDRNDPDVDGASGLSPYLHFGHIGAHEIWHELIKREKWTISKLKKVNGSREGFWNMTPAAESFVDEFVTWREIGYNQSTTRPTVYDQYEGLPPFALTTLKEHEADKRPTLYSLAELEHAKTHDELWNAAQTQLVREGRMHNYLRMLWGKKILEWSPTPRDALARLIELNNKYALDGRNPNSYSGIFWVLGRFDRAWGPERKIFGKVRYMSSDNTAKKLSVTRYLEKYQPKVKAISR